jgi:uncharacterized protein YndB with AHSA1/START domain
METETQGNPAAARPDTTVERTSDREVVVTRSFKAPSRVVFDAWAKPELFRRWWIPASFGMTIVSCEMDVRTGGTYRLQIRHPAAPEPMAFFGRYLEVVPGERIVWTNDEGGEGEGAVTTVTFEETGGETQVVLSDLYPSKEALDEAAESGATSGYPVQFDELEAFLATGAR